MHLRLPFFLLFLTLCCLSGLVGAQRCDEYADIGVELDAHSYAIKSHLGGSFTFTNDANVPMLVTFRGEFSKGVWRRRMR